MNFGLSSQKCGNYRAIERMLGALIKGCNMKTMKTDVHCLKVGDKVLSLHDENQVNTVISKNPYIPFPQNPMVPEGGRITGGTSKHAFALILENDKGSCELNYTYDVVFKKVQGGAKCNQGKR